MLFTHIGFSFTVGLFFLILYIWRVLFKNLFAIINNYTNKSLQNLYANMYTYIFYKNISNILMHYKLNISIVNNTIYIQIRFENIKILQLYEFA